MLGHGWTIETLYGVVGANGPAIRFGLLAMWIADQSDCSVSCRSLSPTSQVDTVNMFLFKNESVA